MDKDKTVIAEKLIKAFPLFEGLSKEALEKISEASSLMKIPKETVIFSEGDECKHLALILSGSARIYKLAETGKEITLYRLGRGDSCILTVSCVMSQKQFPAMAVVEEDIEAIVAPAFNFREWIDEYRLWREYICDLLTQRLADVMSVVEEIAFRKIDSRIADLLIESATSGNGIIKKTHQELAMDLGTSREVVSRILKDFEHRGYIKLSRGSIAVEDAASLKYVGEG